MYTSRRRFKVQSLTLAPRVPPPSLPRSTDSEVGQGKGTIRKFPAGERALRKVTRKRGFGGEGICLEQRGKGKPAGGRRGDGKAVTVRIGQGWKRTVGQGQKRGGSELRRAGIQRR